ncbi:Starch-binding associating with outer membrane [Arachidicoccus rhizosphaerae]|uniref:Starch-binding associating with outer membrane n=1 Tax=Arachidicoccus rhizosphaerae TaxID=551991 RepID=A0A1H3VM97_9BACT|nr:SusD/RagB family nutrient-binding outer membrane lipoprotein [Arachidicoccus rhizosphaerae]SDZ75238.1 Starch-binding associating with outer membrane [Arachidicoccus rhizosphaerae]
MNTIIKKSFKYTCWLAAASIVMTSCKKFDEVNTDPTAANEDQVQVEYLINNAIIGAQMNPDIAERSFVLYWEPAGRQVSDFDAGAVNVANYDDGWTSNYWNGQAGWQTKINKAIDIARSRIASKENLKEYTNDLLQVAKIWRVYLMSELTDNFGPIPIDGFQGTNPQYASVKDVYYYMLDELKGATDSLDESITVPDAVAKEDPAFGYDFTKWKKYGNSMRLRLAMRLSEVDPSKAQAEFEDAAKSLDDLLTDNSDNFAVQEVDGWSDLSGVMSRSWDVQPMSVTFRNLAIGLGGIGSGQQVSKVASTHVKKNANDLGLRYTDFFPLKNNDPNAGYWLDSLPTTIDPRAYVIYSIPGDTLNSNYPDQNGSYDVTSVRNLYKSQGGDLVKVKSVNAAFTFNARIDGDWGEKDQLNELVNYGGTMPRLNMNFRNSSGKRVFFGAWETYFLLAEAGVRGWDVPVAAKAAYEDGIKASFNFWGIDGYLTEYLNSTAYNNDGTSVSWDNTTEPPTARTMTFTDGLTGTAGTAQIKYAENALYKAGKKNDHLSKIITQKFLAQVPWVPLENWSDHRRLGLPFFENPTVEKAISTLPALTDGTYSTSSIQFLPQRLKYPSGLVNQNPTGYQQAVGLLGTSGDVMLNPLWWAQQK